MKSTIILMIVLVHQGCGGKSTPASIPPSPSQVTCIIIGKEHFPALKFYTDSRGRDFCYDDTEAQADPALLPLRWDKAGEQIKSVRPDADLNNPFPLNGTVFKFMPHDGIDPANGRPYWKLSRVPGYENDPRAETEAIYGLTTVNTWPIVEYVLAEGVPGVSEPLSVVRHESLHLRWWGLYPQEKCPGINRGLVYELVEHGDPNCDPFAK